MAQEVVSSLFDDDKIFSRSSILPHEFFEVRQDCRPKGRPIFMYSFAAITYLLTIGVFIYLYISQSSLSTTESMISSTDVSDGTYSCSMLTTVTSTVQDNKTAMHSTSYNLINFNGGKVACQSYLSETDPCNTNLLINLGSSSPLTLQFQGIPAVYDDNILYFANASSVLDTYYFYKYDISKGTLQSRAYPGEYYFQFNSHGFLSVAVDSSGGAWALGYVYGYPSYIQSFNDGTVIYISNHTLSGMVNDNVYNMYFFDENHLYLYYASSQSVVPFTNLTTTVSVYLSTVAIYSHGSNVYDIKFITYYYGEYGFVYDLFSKDLSTDEIVSIANGTSISYITFDLTGKYLYYSEYYSDGTIKYILATDKDLWGAKTKASLVTSPTSIYEYVHGWAFVNDGNTLLATLTDYSAEDFLTLNVNISSGNYSTINQGYNATEVGWNLCGYNLLGTLPKTSYGFQQLCSSNGLSWNAVLYQGRYFIQSDAEAYFRAEARGFCTSDVYDKICSTITKSGPYICSRTIYPQFFAVLSTAIANSHLFMTVVVVIFGFILQQISKRDPPAEQRRSSIAVKSDEEKIEMFNIYEGDRLPEPRSNSRNVTQETARPLRERNEVGSTSPRARERAASPLSSNSRYRRPVRPAGIMQSGLNSSPKNRSTNIDLR